MSDKEYENKNQERWEDLISLDNEMPSKRECFDYGFSAGYTIGVEENNTDKEIVFVDMEEVRKIIKDEVEETKKSLTNNYQISGWVTIDEAYNACFLHTSKPHQESQEIADTGDYDTVWVSDGKIYLFDRDFFPDMDSDSEPIEVELMIKREKK